MSNLSKIILVIVLLLFIFPVIAQDNPSTPYTSDNSGFTVFHPPLWLVYGDEEGIVTLVDSYTTSFIYERGFALEDSQQAIRIYSEVYTPGPLEVMVNAFVVNTDIEGLVQRDITIDGRMAVAFTSEEQENFTLYFFETSTGETISSITFYFPRNRRLAEQTAESILATVTTEGFETLLEGSPAQTLDTTFSADTTSISFDYPSAWGIDAESIAPTVIVSSDDSEIQTYAEDGRFGSRMEVINPSVALPDVVDLNDLRQIAEAYIANDLTMSFRAEYTELDEFETDVLLAFENVLTYGEVGIFFLRLEHDNILVWRIATPDGEFSTYYETLKSVLATVQVNEATSDSSSTSSAISVTLNEIASYEFEGFALYGATDLALSPDGQQIAVTFDESVYILDVNTLGILNEISVGYETQAVDYAPDGNSILIVNGSSLQNSPTPIRIYDLTTNRPMNISRRSGIRLPTDATFNFDGTQIAVSARVSTSSIYNADISEVIHEFAEGEFAVFSSQGTYYAGNISTFSEQDVYVVDATTLDIVSSVSQPDEQGLKIILFSPDETRLAIGYTGFGEGRSEVEIIDVSTGDLVSETTYTINFTADTLDGVGAIAFTPDSQFIAVGNETGSIFIYDVATGQPLAKVTGNQRSISGLEFNADGTQLFSSSEEGVIRIWDVMIVESE